MFLEDQTNDWNMFVFSLASSSFSMFFDKILIFPQEL